MKNKRLCVIGAGYWGKNHIRTLAHLKVLSGIVELNDHVLNAALNLYPGIRGHSSVDEALLENYDAYTIATPAKTHYKIAKKIIKAKNMF